MFRLTINGYPTLVNPYHGLPSCHGLMLYIVGYPRAFYTDLNRLICKTKPDVRAFGLVAHRITSSAWKRTEGGMVRPSAWAVLRLMTSSNVVGCSTGRSAGMVPFKILST
jgi:hypothetical protein